MARRSLLLLSSVLALGVLASGCSDDHGRAAAVTPAPVSTDPGKPPLPGAGVVVEVDSLDNVFLEDTISVRAGTTVHFVNRGLNDHNVLPATGTAWGVQTAQFGPGEEYSAAFDQPGTYVYYCSIHGLIKDGKPIGMAGTIEVAG